MLSAIVQNMNIIENIHIRNIMKKGLNFREKEQYNKVKAVNSIQTALSNFITEISNTSKIPVNTFSAWKKNILDKAKSTIEPLSVHPSTKVFNNIKNSQDLNKIHNRFVIVPVDKASNNIGIVCKFFYIQKLILEINNSGNFQVSPVSKNAIMDNYSSMLRSKYNITNTLPSLPYLFWDSEIP